MNDELADDLTKLFSHGQQLWLLGAGASLASNLPLVSGLTERVRRKLADKPFPDNKHTPLKVGHVIEGLRSDIGPTATIEKILDHLADHASLAQRSTAGAVMTPVLTPKDSVGKPPPVLLTFDDLAAIRREVLSVIRDTIRYGYVHSANPKHDREGSPENPIICIEHHKRFVGVVFDELRAGREPRLGPVELFTTNYDTLIEDALALKRVRYIDGLRGGAVAYWDSDSYWHPEMQPIVLPRAILVKLHGSIDWVREKGQVIRRRIHDPYPASESELLIYPQASKYDLAQRDPFEKLFFDFRTSLNRPAPQVLLVCGYGFGDDHIDDEMESALAREGSQLTLLVFREERDGKPARWQSKEFGDRVYTITGKGI